MTAVDPCLVTPGPFRTWIESREKDRAARKEARRVIDKASRGQRAMSQERAPIIIEAGARAGQSLKNYHLVFILKEKVLSQM